MNLLQDIRFGLRMLWKSPAFTTVAVLTLALGIGANTAIFSVVDAVVLRPLPYYQPDRLVLVNERIPQATPEPITVSAPDVLQFQRENHVFYGVAAFRGTQFDFSAGSAPRRINAAKVNFNLFSVLGVQPIMGRTFTETEDQPDHPVAILSYGVWQDQFAGNANVIGRTLKLDREVYTIVGVMPRNLVFPLPGMSQGEAAELYVPMAFTHEDLTNIGDNFNYSVMARLRPGISAGDATSDLEVIARNIMTTYPPQVRQSFQLGALATSLNERVAGNSRALLLLMLGAVGFVLLIACANVAILLLTRAAGREREIAVRLAIGAGKAQLFRQFLIESLLLSMIGAMLGLGAAAWSTQALVKFIPADIPRAHTIGLNLPVLGFTLVLAVLAGVVFGLAPALSAWRSNLNSALQKGGRNAALGPHHQRLRSVLVVGQVTLSLILLIGAGLLVRSFAHVLATDPGFQSQHVLTASINLPWSEYQKAERSRAFFQQLIARLEAMPGAKLAGASTDLPLHGQWLHLFTPESYQPSPGGGLNKSSHSVILGNYLQTMGVPLIRGRYFTDQDKTGSTHVLIISDSLAKRYWPGQDPLGKRLKWGGVQSEDPWLTVVGVVGDVKQSALDSETLFHTYESVLQNDASFNGLNVAVRATGDPSTLASSLRTTIWGLDNQLAVAQVRTMDEVIGESTASRRFNLYLLSAFAGAALLLAAIGIYGVVAYSVGQRTQEIGVRMALGAARGDVLRMVLRPGMVLTFVGVVLGVGGALALTRLMSSMLFGVHSTDPLTFGITAIVLVLAAASACYMPARRAAKVDPMVALRYE